MKQREKAVIFNAEQVRAVLDGRKTRFSVPVKGEVNEAPSEWAFVRYPNQAANGIRVFDGALFEKPSNGDDMTIKPPYQPGDLLYVRETWHDESLPSEVQWFVYKADNPDWVMPSGMHWKSPAIMPKEAARIWLGVEEVRVQRLMDISEGDAKAEGFEMYTKYSYIPGEAVMQPEWSISAVELYTRELTSKLSPEFVNTNLWVWVITFKVLSLFGKPSLPCNKS